MKTYLIYLFIVLLSLTALVGCVESGSQPEGNESASTITRTPTSTKKESDLTVVSTPAKPTEEADAATQETPMPTPASPFLQALVSQAITDLADQLMIEASQVELIEVRAMVWPDGALGCPQPGLAYTQVQREGALIRLRVGKTIYHYHTGGQEPFLCEKPVLESGDSQSP